MIDKDIIERINNETDILALASEFVTLTKKGKNYFGLSPFVEEKTPSFSVSPEKNIAMCMSSKKGGRPINFYRQIKNISFEEAAIELGRRLGIDMGKSTVKKDPHIHDYEMLEVVMNFYHSNLLFSKDGKKALEYLNQREITDATIKHFKLGFASKNSDQVYQMLSDQGYDVKDMERLGVVKTREDGTSYDLFSNRLMFPITNKDGRCVGFSGRTLEKNEQVKYMNSPETTVFKKGETLYHYFEGLNDIRKANHVVLYEGFFDVISSYQAGIKAGVATMGTALTKAQAELIKKISNSVIVAYDGDKPGLKAIDAAIPILEAEKLNIEVLKIPEGLDPDDFIKSYGPEAYERLFGESTIDAYMFRYHYYKMSKDLNNANDIKAFKDSVMRMLRYADNVIREKYYAILARDLNVDINAVRQPKEVQTVTQFKKKEPKESKTFIIDKYERAERELILTMLESKDNAEIIDSKLSPTDFAHVNNNIIRTKLMDYYRKYGEMDTERFSATLDTEYRDYFIETYLKNEFYQKKLTLLNNEGIDTNVKILQSASYARREKFLKQKLAELENNIDKDTAEYLRYAVELAELKKKKISDGGK